MLNRLGLVIHWSGFISGLMAFALCFSLIAEGFFDEWENKRRDLALTVVIELQMRWDEERESELDERGLRQLNSAKERGLIKYNPRPEDGRPAFVNPFPVRSRSFSFEEAVSGVNPDDAIEVVDLSLFEVLNLFSWYWYVLGLLFSPVLIVLIMLPAWATRFILTGEKVFFPWRSADA